MLYLRVHDHGEVIRVLLLSLEFGIPDLPSFLQMTRERERGKFLIKNRSRSLLHPDPREIAGGVGGGPRSVRPPFGRLGGAHVAKKERGERRGRMAWGRLLKTYVTF